MPVVLKVMLLFPAVVCAALYGYYFFAQRLVNPAQVVGVLKSAACEGGAISKQGVKTGLVHMRKIYSFPTRSVSPNAGGTSPPVDEKAEFIEYERTSDCEAALQDLAIGSQRAVWAGEDEMTDRFRARFTPEQELPALALLWVPGCLAALAFWAWRRAAR